MLQVVDHHYWMQDADDERADVGRVDFQDGLEKKYYKYKKKIVVDTELTNL